MTTIGEQKGVGVVRIEGFGVWALWIFDPGDDARAQTWRIRMSLDEFALLGVHEYQRVRLKIGREAEQTVYLRCRRDAPPWVWAEFGIEVRR